jgi:N-carbamoyl-L-amino-acid hydrolase
MATTDRIEVSSQRLEADLNGLARIVDDSKPGYTRTAFGELYRDGAQWVAERMADAGLQVSIDLAGNVVGTLYGRHEGAALVTGSHIDTVEKGGRYDGIVGVLGAIEAVRAMRDASIKLDRPVNVIAFFGEEASPYGVAHIGSRALGGTLTRELLLKTDSKNQTLADGLRTRTGIDPEHILKARWSPRHMAAYVELHIEQGAVLEQTGNRLGLVTGIAGARRFTAAITGQPDHAGATPMDRRHDAFCGASKLTLLVEDFARSVPTGVATVVPVDDGPRASNIVPGSFRLVGDIRSLEEEWIDALQTHITTAASQIGPERGLDIAIGWPSYTPPTVFTNPMQQLIGQVLQSSGHEFVPITSGAGHDAQEISQLGPVGMIFIPSVEGRSHCPEEFTALDDVTIGVQALTEALIALDQTDPALLGK